MIEAPYNDSLKRTPKSTFTKKNDQSQLTCQRADGSIDMANLGPSLPHHDLAHYVAELALRIIMNRYHWRVGSITSRRRPG